MRASDERQDDRSALTIAKRAHTNTHTHDMAHRSAILALYRCHRVATGIRSLLPCKGIRLVARLSRRRLRLIGWLVGYCGDDGVGLITCALPITARKRASLSTLSGTNTHAGHPFGRQRDVSGQKP